MSVASSRCTSTDSRPALTRASSNCNIASVLPTPLDYPAFRGSDASKSYARTVNDVRVRMPSQDRLSLPSGRVGSFATSEQYTNEEIRPADSYFPPTQHRPATPIRNNSTKDLINRYESMSPSPLGTPSRTPVPSPLGLRQDSTFSETPSSRPLSALKQKGRSPLRDSFRNLMSLFGKKGKCKDDSTSLLSSRYEDSVMSSSPANVLSVSPQVQQNTPRIADDHPPLRSGQVLYLARSGGDSTLPVWTSCKASLLEDRILLEWLTAYGNPSSSTVMLRKSTDVHSLAKSQVDPVEKSLLPLTGQDSYIFELTYPGGVPEKFALTSVAERSAWVSCIWDVLLKLERTGETEDSSLIGRVVVESSTSFAANQASQDPFMDETSLPPHMSAFASSASMSRERSGGSYAASSTVVAQSVVDSIRMRTGRHQPSSDTASLSGDIISEAPSTPTKSTLYGIRGDLLSSTSSSPSVQNLGNLSIVQSRLLEINSSNTNHNIPRVSSQVSRRSSIISNYSDSPSRAPSHLITPRSLQKDTYRQRSQVNRGSLSRRNSTASNYEDETSIYDFYAQESHTSRILPSVIDESEAKAATTPRVSSVHSFNVLNLRPPKEPNNRASGLLASCIRVRNAERIERTLPDAPHPVNRQPSQRNIDNYAAIPTKAASEPNDAHPLLAVMQDHAEQQQSQTMDIGNQIASLQQDIVTMSTELRSVIAEQRPGTSLRGVLEDLCAKMERAATTNGAGLQELHQKIDLIVAQLLAQSTATSTEGGKIQKIRPSNNGGDVASGAVLDEISFSIVETREMIKNNMPLITEKLSSLQEALAPTDVSHIDAKLSELLEVYRSLQSSRIENDAPPPSIKELRNISPDKAPDDPEAVNAGEKADEPDATAKAATEEVSKPLPPDIESKLSEVLTLLKGGEENRKLGADQQTENARYLQELNKWLESFVSNGTTQIQSVANNVERICQELVPLQDVGGEKGEGEGPKSIGIRSEVAALASAMKAVEERDTVLKALVTETLQTVKGKEAENKPFDMDAVVQMIERQKQEQESTLRGIAAELSNDIRGERLRFVEAMKEATAINVQVHVEEFKKELGKEVMMMTCEVGRLQRERQILEQQIADLFTFFAKQRAEMEQNQAEMVRQSLQVPQAAPTRSNSRGRPLPVPKNK
ncbi:hypothetical protein ACEPAG_7916 [Sanghuangporus baumii]